MNILERLKAETREEHEALEKLMYGQKLREGKLQMSEYRHLILTHFFIHQALEKNFFEGKWTEKLPGLMYEKRQKLPALLNDLRNLGEKEPRACIKYPSFESAAQVLGAFYVLEGSTLGGEIIHRILRRTPELAEIKVYSYYGIYGEDIRQYWLEFRKLCVEKVHSPEDQYSALSSAKEIFNLYRQVFSKLQSDRIAF